MSFQLLRFFDVCKALRIHDKKIKAQDFVLIGSLFN